MMCIAIALTTLTVGAALGVAALAIVTASRGREG
jgi:hypothetical protein